MIIGILREGKIPPDKRVPLTPEQCVEVQKKFPGTKIIVQSSAIRCFGDEDYTEKGITVREDLSECDILLGVKEVPLRDLIANKHYLFFSHTIKKQSYNRELLRTIIHKNIQLTDYEVLTDKEGFRIIGFGRFAGLVGAYNGIRALGLRSGIFSIKPAHECKNLVEMLHQLDGIELPPVKIAVTGDGRVSGGVIEVMEYMNIRRTSADDFLSVEKPESPLYTRLSPKNYVRRKDRTSFDLIHFFENPEMYENNFLPFTLSTDMLIAAAYWDTKAPVLFTADDMKKNDFRISIISDITCDIDGSIPSTKRAATIDDPFYDYNPATEMTEPPFSSENNITVQAVDNLPCELPVDASEGFGRSLIDKVFPALMGNDIDGIIERATITRNGALTDRYKYLQDFLEGKDSSNI